MDLDKILSKHRLPCAVTTNQPLTCDKRVIVPAGSKVLLHEVHTERRIRMMDNRTSRVFYLPMTSRQKFEWLPKDAMFDDLAFQSVTEVMNCSKLPHILRCVQEYYTDDIEEVVPLDETFEVNGIETDEQGKRFLTGVLCSTKQKLRLQERDVTATFSTMPCEELLHASELAELDMPQRVRVIPKLLEDVLVKREDLQVVTLLSVENIRFVLASNPRCDRLIYIPSNIDFVNQRNKYTPVKTSTELTEVFSSLPPLYKYLNITLGVTEVGIMKMPVEWEPVPQPLPRVLDEWITSHEGREVARTIHTKHVDDLREEIEELNCLVTTLTFELTEFKKNKRPIGKRKPAPPPRQSSIEAPPRPPKPPKPEELVMKMRVLSSQEADDDTYEDVSLDTLKRQSSGEVDYRAMAEILRESLVKKEQVICNLRNELGNLEKFRERYKSLEKQNIELTSELTNVQNKLDASINSVYYTELPENTGSLPPGYVMTSRVESTKRPYQPLYGNREQKSDCQSNVKAMSVEDTCTFLSSNGFQDYSEKFRAEMIDGHMLLHLDKEILVGELGMRPLHAVRLLTLLDK